MLKVCVLASGSGGNAILVSGRRTRLLVDAGLSGKQLEARLAAAGTDPAELAGLLVTHEHGDHIAGVGVLARRYRLPVHIDEATYAAARARLGKIPRLEFLPAGEFKVGELRCRSFPLPHDAVNPLGFSISTGRHRLAILTDAGTVTTLLRHCAKESDIVVLESNYEPELLYESERSWFNKQRVLGDTGHLSNEDAAVLVGELAGTRVQAVFLAHISRDHNNNAALWKRLPDGNGSPRLYMTYQDRISEWVAVGEEPA